MKFFSKMFFKKLIVNFFFKFKFQKNEKFSKKCKFKKNDENVQKNQKSEKPSKNQRKIFLQKNLKFFIFPKIIAEFYFYQKHS